MQRVKSMKGWFAALVLLGCVTSGAASAQITSTTPGQTTVLVSPTTTLFDFLVNRLRATTADQQTYVREVVQLVEQERLEKRLVLALERYSRRKNPFFPLPIYERALRVEGAKRGVTVPLIREIVARSGQTSRQAVRDSRIR